MSWTLLFGLVLSLALALLAALQRRGELARMSAAVQARDTAVRHGADKAQLQHPVIDLSRCLGCGTCVAACPEDGVLEIVHGQAIVARGARCVGVSACERECPVGAITVTLGDVSERNDIPVLSEGLEAVGSPGLFLAGEVTAHALIKTAIDHGTAVAAEVARRAPSAQDAEILDLVVVGAGPAGIACSLEAKKQGLRFVTLDQEAELGGTVAKYPRAKLVLTQPIELPLYGKFKASSYSKEELIELWQRVASEQDLPLRNGETLQDVTRDEDGSFTVRTQNGSFRARHVCLALGRRGSPRRLEIPGADSAKVLFDLLDARAIQGRNVAVVGGGDSAVETALALAAQPGNRVHLIHRKESFFRIRARNEERLESALANGSIEVLTGAEVSAIHETAIEVHVARGSSLQRLDLPNDLFFVQIGGVPPFELLQRSGVSFDSELLQKQVGSTGLAEAGTGLVRALAAGLLLTLVALGFALWNFDYYSLPRIERPAHPKHASLRPGQGIGLGLGIASVGLILLNLAYLLRRSPKFRFSFGSLQLWMTSHVATGILALLCALLHAAMSARNTIGGRAFWMLALLMVTGAIGRYLYAWVPRAANGRELQLSEVKARLAYMSADWDGGQQRFRERARSAVEALVERKQWKTSFGGRALALFGVRRDLNRVLDELKSEGTREGVSKLDILETQRLARKAHRTALMAAHFEDLRALMSAWRWLHRWAAALMVLLVILHVIYALKYGSFLKGADPGGLL